VTPAWHTFQHDAVTLDVGESLARRHEVGSYEVDNRASKPPNENAHQDA